MQVMALKKYAKKRVLEVAKKSETKSKRKIHAFNQCRASPALL